MDNCRYIFTEAGREALGIAPNELLANIDDLEERAVATFIPKERLALLGQITTAAAFDLRRVVETAEGVEFYLPAESNGAVFALNQSPYLFKVTANVEPQILREAILHNGSLANVINQENLVTPNGWLIRSPNVYMGALVKNVSSYHGLQVMDYIRGAQRLPKKYRVLDWTMDRGIRGEVGLTLAQRFSRRYVQHYLRDFADRNLLLVPGEVSGHTAQGIVYIIDQYLPIK